MTNVNLNFHAAAPATTTVRIAVDKAGVNNVVLNNVAGNTDITYPVTTPRVTSAGVAVAGADEYWNLTGNIAVINVSASDALVAAVVVTFDFKDN